MLHVAGWRLFVQNTRIAAGRHGFAATLPHEATASVPSYAVCTYYSTSLAKLHVSLPCCWCQPQANPAQVLSKQTSRQGLQRSKPTARAHYHPTPKLLLTACKQTGMHPADRSHPQTRTLPCFPPSYQAAWVHGKSAQHVAHASTKPYPRARVPCPFWLYEGLPRALTGR